ncbi:MAG: type II secretion system major pseudopilin GspG [Roseobacter sp.]
MPLPKMNQTVRDKEAGVTLLEVMIVLAIMALVIGVAAPRFLDSFGRAKSQTASVQMSNIKAAVQMFYIDVGALPTSTQGLNALTTRPQNIQAWRGPYLEDDEGLIDPWGRRFLLRIPGETKAFDILSYGRDGQPGGDNEDRDLKD